MVTLRQYVLYKLDAQQDGGHQPVEQIKEQAAVSKTECGLWAKTGSYIGYIEVNPGPEIDNVISAIHQNHGLRKLNNTQVINLIEEWWIGNPAPQHLDGRTGSWLPADVVDGFVVKNSQFY